MNSYRYIGKRPELRDETALGQHVEHQGEKVFVVQCTGTLVPKEQDGETIMVPRCIVGGVDYAHGWHLANETEWEKVEI